MKKVLALAFSFLLMFGLVGCDLSWLFGLTTTLPVVTTTDPSGTTAPTTTTENGSMTTASTTEADVYYTVFFYDEDGTTLIGMDTVESGGTAVTLIVPTKAATAEYSYLFSGWDQPLTNITANTSVSAIYAATPVSYSITYIMNGGYDIAIEMKPFASALVMPSSPIRDGYAFSGWYADEALTIAFSILTMPAENLTVYAKWTVNQYTITVNVNGGSSFSPIIQDYGTVVTTPVTTRSGYAFSGWYADAGLTTAYAFGTMPAEHITVYAKWTINQYTITVNVNGGLAVSPIFQNYGTAVATPVTTRSGYAFGGWYADAGLTTAYTFGTMPAENITVYAKWTINQYTITVNVNGGSAVSPIIQDSGTAVTTPVTTRSGYAFSGWYADEALTIPYVFTTMPAENISVYAKWAINQYTLTVKANGGSAVAPITQDYGTAVTAPISTRSGYTFGGWYADAGLTKAYAFGTMPAENITVYAGWTIKQYTITVNVNGGTAVSPIIQDYGTAVTAPISTRSGYTFGGWYADAGLTTAYAFGTMPAENITVYAKWTDFVEDGLSFDTAYFLESGVQYNGSVNDADPAYYFRFIPESSGTYMLYTLGYLQSIATLYDAARVILTDDGGSGAYGNARIIVDLVAGTTYYWVWDPSMTWVGETEVLFGISPVDPENQMIYATTLSGKYLLIGYVGAEVTVVVPAIHDGIAVDGIGKFAFYDNDSIVDLTISTGVTFIADEAFRDCDHLESIDLPGTIAEMGIVTFADCPALSDVNFEEGITELGDWTFQNCTALAAIVLPASLAAIGAGAFENNIAMTSITLPAAVMSIGDNAFSGCGNLTINAEIASQPAGWSTIWNPDSRPVVWGDVHVPLSTVTFVLNGGDGMTSITREEGQALSAPFNPWREGFMFAGWYADEALTIPYVFTTMPVDDITIYAAWTLVEEGGFVFTLLENGTYEVSDYTGTAWEVVIPSTYLDVPVTSIGIRAFYECTNIENITIPTSVTAIGNSAFGYCYSLTSITIPASVTSIGTYAFNYCTSLSSVTIPPGVTNIGNGTFAYCNSLTSITIPSGVINIGQYTFNGCSSLSSITIPASVTSIGYAAFAYCYSLTSIIIPAGVTSIGDYAFSECYNLTIYAETASEPAGWSEIWNPSECRVVWGFDAADSLHFTLKPDNTYELTSYNGPETAVVIPAVYEGLPVTSIGANAFEYRTGIVSIVIPEGVTAIGEYAFYRCESLSDVSLPSTLLSIARRAFSNCYALASITLPEGLISIGDRAFCYDPLLSAIVLPESLQTIGAGAFVSCFALTTVTIPANVVSIGIYPFGNCQTLTEILVDASNTSFKAVDGVLFSHDGTVLIQYPFAKPGSVYTIPDGTMTIGEYAFAWCPLSSVILPDSITTIRAGAFIWCFALTTITIPANVTSIGIVPFGDCTELSEILVDPANTSFKAVDGVLFSHDGTLLIQYPVAKAGASYAVPQGTITIGESAFYDCVNLYEMILPPSLTTIGAWAFELCTSLTSIVIPAGVTSIGDYAFSECYNLTIYAATASQPAGWSTDWNAYECFVVWGYDAADSLHFTLKPDDTYELTSYDGFETTVIVPAMYEGLPVTSIGANAFEYLTGIVSIVIPEGVTAIGEYAFFHCESLRDVSLPSTLLSIASRAFSHCYALVSITLPDSLMTIGDSAFSSSHSLTTVLIPANVASIGIYPFGNIPALTEIQVAAENIDFVDIDGVLFTHDMSLLIQYPGGRVETDYVVPDGVLTIDTAAFAWSGVTSVTLPDSVTTIGDSAFQNCPNLASIQFGAGVTSIGDSAFYQCYALSAMTLPEGLSSIGTYAFYECISLVSVVIPWGVTSIDYATFANCSSLTSIIIPAGVTSIGDYAFYYCSSLTNIALPDSVTSIGEYAFSYCSSLTDFTIPANVTAIGISAFRNCINLTSITIPASVISIGDSAFSYCSSLTSITIPANVTIIGDYAFYYCSSLAEIAIPVNVTSIGEGAFWGCDSLSSITIPASMTNIGYAAFAYCYSLTSIVIPAGVTSIGDYVFHNCTSLTIYAEAASQPVGWSEIWNSTDCFVVWGFDAADSLHFTLKPDNTYELTSYNGSETAVVIPAMYEGLPVTSIGANAFEYLTGIVSVVIPEGITAIGEYAFYHCDNLSDISLPSTLLSIALRAFSHCYALESIVLPEGLISIGDRAFCYASILSAIVLPESLQTIGAGAFVSCFALATVTIPANVVSIGIFPFGNCTALEEIFVDAVNTSFKAVDGVLFSHDGTLLIQYPFAKPGSDYIVPDGTVTIGESAFSWCPLSSVTLPDSVTTVGDSAFQNCPILASIHFGIGVTSIGDSAFYQCYALSDMALPEGLSSIGTYAFYECISLVSVVIPDGVTALPEGVFAGCTNLATVILPDGLLSLGAWAFERCEAIVEIDLPAGLTAIGYGAFMDCYSLGSIYLPASVTVIEDWAFDNCYAITIHVAADTQPAGWTSLWNGDGYPVEWADNPTAGSSFATAIVLEEGLAVSVMIETAGDAQYYRFTPATDGYYLIRSNGGFDTYGWLFDAFHHQLQDCDDITGDSNFELFDYLEAGSTYYVVAAMYSGSQLGTFELVATKFTTPESQFTFSLNEDGTYDITGFVEGDSRVIVPSSHLGVAVTGIGAYAFANLNGIYFVSLPATITTIADFAFYRCVGLPTLNIPAGVTAIGMGAFAGCANLAGFTVDPANPVFSTVDGVLFSNGGTWLVSFPGASHYYDYDVPDGVERIRAYAFMECASITFIHLPASLQFIGDEAFAGCEWLTTLLLPGNVIGIGIGAFRDCDNLLSLELPASVTDLGVDAVAGSGQVTVYAGALAEPTTWSSGWNPEGRPVVWGYVAPGGGTSFATAIPLLPDTPLRVIIDTIGMSVYFVIIPDTTGLYAFTSAGSEDAYVKLYDASFALIDEDDDSEIDRNFLLFHYLEAGSVYYLACSMYNSSNRGEYRLMSTFATTDASDFTFTLQEDGMYQLVSYEGEDTDIVIPSVYLGIPVTCIGSFAFGGDNSIVSITIPDSVILIGEGVFYQSYALSAIYVLPGNSAFVSVDGSLFDAAMTTLIAYPQAQFGETYTIPATVTALASHAFGKCRYLNEIYLPDGLLSIGAMAFASSSLGVITLPASLEFIDEYAFLYCGNLSEIAVAAGNAWFTVVDGVLYDFAVTTLVAYPHNLGYSDFTVPATVRIIPGYAFFESWSLNSVTLPAGLESLGDQVFTKCYALTAILVDDENSHFMSVDGVLFSADGTTLIAYPYGKTETEYIVPAGVTAIGSYAFSYNPTLVTVRLPDGLTTIGKMAFWMNFSLVDVQLPATLVSIGRAAFYACSLAELVIPASVVTIEMGAFSFVATCVIYAEAMEQPAGWDEQWNYSDYQVVWGYVAVSQPTITFDTNGGSVVASIAQDANTVVSAPADPTRNGYVFAGWFADEALTIPYSFTTMPADDLTLFAAWTPSAVPDFTFTLLEDGTYELSGYVGTDIFVVVPATYLDMPVSGIGDWAFAYCAGILSITIPASVTRIGDYAFRNCSNLTAFTIPDGVTSIGDYAFYGCYSLTSIVIPSSMTGISDYAFGGCSGLTSVTIPSSVTRIGNWAFGGCNGLTSFAIPASVTSIGYSAFSDCSSLASITIPAGVTGIEDGTFSNCSSLTSITIPAGVTGIGIWAFLNCTSLTSITIPASVTGIGLNAFEGCTGLTIYAAIASQPSGWHADWNISGCPVIWGDVPLYQSTIAFDANGGTIVADITQDEGSAVSAPAEPTRDGYVFAGWFADEALTIPYEFTTMPADDRLVFAGWTPILDEGFVFTLRGNGYYEVSDYTGSASILVIPSSYLGIQVTSIGASAFQNCTGLTSITVPDSVTMIGSGAFSGCSGLTSITLPFVGSYANASASFALFGYVFGTTTYVGGTSTDQNYATYYLPTSLRTVTITSAASLGSYAFYNCSALTSITLPDTMTSIGSSAFYGCAGLTEIIIPAGVTSLADSVFKNCSGLTDIVIPDGVTAISASAFSGCSGLLTLTIGSGVKTIGASAFQNCTGLTGITVPDSVTMIGSGAFSGCSGLTSITLPFVGSYANASASFALFGYVFGSTIYDGGTLTSQNTSSFYLPTSLRTVTITSATGISYNAFYGCSALTSIILPDTLTTINGQAFYGCAGLTEIIIPAGVTSLADSVFKNCSGLTDIVIPDGVTAISASAFSGCSGLLTLTIGSGVKTIGASAFQNCTGLTGITVPDSVTMIGSGAFSGCSGLTSITLPFVGSYANASASFALFGYVFGTTTYVGGTSTDQNYATYYLPTSLRTVTITSAASLGSYAFYNCSALTSITLPDTMTSIGSSAFYGCAGLTEIIIPAGVTSLADSVFKNCSGLTDIVIPDGVTAISASAFSGCSGLLTLTIGSGVKTIGASAFQNCTGLTGITVPDSVTMIGSGAFSGCSGLTSITLPFVGSYANASASFALFGYVFGSTIYDGGTLTSQNTSSFYLPTSLRTVTITSATGISYNAFYGCSALTSIILPDTLTTINGQAFYGCAGLTEITIPLNVATIGSDTFDECANMTIYAVAASKPTGWSANWNPDNQPVVWAYVYIPQSTILLNVDGGSAIASITQPEGSVVSTPAGPTKAGFVFAGWFADEALTLPYEFTTMPENDITVYAAWDLVPDDGLVFTLIDDGTYEVTDYIGIATVVVIPSLYLGVPVSVIGEGAFYGLSALTSVTIPDSVVIIRAWAFYGCTNMTISTLPSGLTAIGDQAFYGCAALTGMALPDSLTEIGDFAFYQCVGLTEITIPAGVASVGASAFSGCTGLTNLVMQVGLQRISMNTFRDCSALTDIAIPAGVTEIGYGAFYHCTGLTSVSLPTSLHVIEASAFMICSGLSAIAIPAGVTVVGDQAFRFCTLLTIYPEVSRQPGGWASGWNYSECPVVWGTLDPLQSTITFVVSGGTEVPPILADITASIAAPVDPTRTDHAFDGWFADEALTIPYEFTVMPSSDITLYAAWTFVPVIDFTFTLKEDGTYELSRYEGNATEIIIPSTYLGIPVTSIGVYAFAEEQVWISELTSVVVPDSVTFIGDYAFNRCSSLTSITFGKGLTSIGVRVFFYCVALTSITVDPTNEYLASVDGVLFSKDLSVIIAFPAGRTATSYNIPNGVTSIGYGAFQNCGLASVTMPDSLVSIGPWAFDRCYGFTGFDLPDSVTDIGVGAFYACINLLSITIPEGITRIEPQTFFACIVLSSIVLPESLEYIGDRAFSGVKLTDLVIPAGVTWIGPNAFLDDVALISITIPSGVTYIGYEAFIGCANLTIYAEIASQPYGWDVNWNPDDRPVVWGTVPLPYSIISFEENGGSEVVSILQEKESTVLAPADPTKDGYVFDGWYVDAELTLPYMFTTMPTEDITVYAGWIALLDEGLIFTLMEDGTYAVTKCTSTAPKIIIPSTYLGIPVTRIGTGAFSACINLTTIKIPASVVTIGDYPFWECRSLTTIIVDEASPNLSAHDGILFNKDMTSILIYPVGKSGTSYVIPDGVTSIGYGAFQNTYLTSITIPEGMLVIGQMAFERCYGLTEIVLPASVHTIALGAFFACVNLQSITIPEGVTRIEYFTFYSAGITSIVLPASLTFIDNQAFSNCGNLTEILIPSSVSVVEWNTFIACDLLTIYAEIASQPYGWHADWNIDDRPVVWGIVPLPQSTLSFIPNGGSEVLAMTQEEGTPTTAPSVPTRVGYSFAGWFSDAELTISYEFTSMPTANLVLYAKWAINSYTLTFIENGGTDITDITAEYDTFIDIQNPTRTGYTFNGWYEDAGFTTYYLSDIDNMPARNIMLYAKWTVNYYGINVDPMGGTPDFYIWGPYGAIISDHAVTRTGYTFAGWYEDIEYTTFFGMTVTIIPARDLYLYAKWTINSYTLTFIENGGSDLIDISQDYGTTITTPVDPVKAGYEFAGWYSDIALTTPYTFTTMPAENITIYVKWNPTQTISFNATGGSVIDSITQVVGTDVTAPTAPTKAGYEFAGWYSDAALTEYYAFNTMPADGLTLYADWGTAGLAFSLSGDEYAVSNGTATAANVIIPRRHNGHLVTSINADGFRECWGIISISIPSSISIIGANAFLWCTGLTSITIPSSVTSIGSSAFAVCSHLASVTFEAASQLASIGPQAFSCCYLLSAITIPSSVISIGDWAFRDCRGLTSVTVEASNVNYASDNGVLFNKQKTVIMVYPIGKTEMTYQIPSSVTSIGTYAFANCSGLTSITIPSGVISIGANAFANCSSLSSITIPASVTILGYGAFYGCSYVSIYAEAASKPSDWATGWKPDSQPVFWAVNDQAISFESNGGSAVTAISQDFGTTVIAPAVPTRTGYAFAGWYADAELTTPYTFTTMPPISITLYAQWELVPFESDPIASISSKYNNVLVITASGRVYSWGENDLGQLGIGTTTGSSIPIDITDRFGLANGETIVQVVTGYKFSFALTSAGRLFAWGLNNVGQFGDGTTTNCSVPIEVTDHFILNPGEQLSAIETGRESAYAITSEHRVFSWGNNTNGALATGNYIPSLVAIDITARFSLASGESIVKISSGSGTTMALTSNSRVFAWGNNYWGTFGNGTSGVYNSTPVVVSGSVSLDTGETIVDIILGDAQSHLITSAGRVFSAGHNLGGNVGVNSSAQKVLTWTCNNNYMTLASGETIAELHPGAYHCVVVTTLGRVFVWGDDSLGQQGTVATTNNKAPVDITAAFGLATGETVAEVWASGFHSYLVTSAGRILVWGDNAFGQFGDGTTTDRLVPFELLG